MAPEPTDVDSQNFEEQNQIESTLALIKPDCLTPHRIQAIKDLVQLAGFELVRQKKFWFTRESASEFYLEHKDKAFFEDLISYITCAPVMAFELRQDDAVMKWRKLLGPTDPVVARDTDVECIRAMFGVDITKNAVHGSDSVEAAQRELEFVFSNSIHTMVSDSKEHGDDTLFKSEYTLGIIKPDAVSSGHSETILRAINYKGFEVLKFEKVHMDEDQVKEFYRDQKGKPFYQDLVSFMSNGEVHVVLLKGINAIRGWREMMGPADVDVARITRPQSIRALYGTDEVKNAIHGSESKEAASREIAFFFPDFFDSPSPVVEDATASNDVVNELEAPVVAETDESVTEKKEEQSESIEQPELDKQINGDSELPQEESEVKEQEPENEESPNHVQEDLSKDHQEDQPALEEHEEQPVQTETEDAVENPTESLEPEPTQAEVEEVVEEHTSQTLDSEESIEPVAEASEPLEENELETATQSDVLPEEVTAVHEESETTEPTEVQEEVEVSKQQENEASEPVASDAGLVVDSEVVENEPSGEHGAEAQDAEDDTVAAESDLPKEAVEETSEQPIENDTPEEQDVAEDLKVKEDVAEEEKPEQSDVEQTFALIKPDVYGTSRKEDILQLIKEKQFTIAQSKEVTFTKPLAEELYSEYKGKHFFDNIITLMSSSPCLAMILEKDNAVQEWRSLMGPANSLKAKFESPGSIRALYGTDSIKNAVHGSDSIARARKEIDLVFNGASLETQPQDKDEASEPVDSHIENQKDTQTEVELSHENEPQLDTEVATSEQVEPQPENEIPASDVVPQPQETDTAELQDASKEEPASEIDAQLPSETKTDDLAETQKEIEEPVAELKEAELETQPESNDAETIQANLELEKVEDVNGSEKIEAQPEVLDKEAEEKPVETPIQLERTLALIKPDAYGAGNKVAILEIIKNAGFAIVKEKEVSLTKEQAEEFYKEHAGKSFYDNLVGFMSSQPIYAMVLEKDNAIKAWRELIGPTDSTKAKETCPQSIRALYGTDGSQNAVHGSDSVDSATREIKIVFDSASTPASSNVSQSDVEQTLALIKPDAYGAGRKVSIQKILKKEGFTIVKEKEVRLTRLKVKEFYSEHEGKPFFEKLVSWMSSAPIYAMILRKEGAIKAWRDLMGPTNSVKAKEVAPKSIRALYGTDGSKNAVHGSDSFASASREISIIFGNVGASNGVKKPTRSPVMRAAPANGSRVATSQVKSRPVSVVDATNVKRGVRPSGVPPTTSAAATAPKRSSMPPTRRSPTSGEPAKSAVAKDAAKTRVPSTLRTATKPIAGATSSRTPAPRPTGTTTTRKPAEPKAAPTQTGPGRPVATRPRPASAASKERSSVVDRLTRPTAASATKSGEHEAPKTRISKSPTATKVPAKRESTLKPREITKNGSKESISTRASSRSSTTSSKVGVPPRKAPVPSAKPGAVRPGVKPVGQARNVKPKPTRGSPTSATPTGSASEATSIAPSAEHSDAETKDEENGEIHETVPGNLTPTVDEGAIVNSTEAGVVGENGKQPEEESTESSNQEEPTEAPSTEPTQPPAVSAQ